MTGVAGSFVLERPTAAPRIVYDSPHSGRQYPPDFDTVATREQLRWVEDAYVDDLLRPGVAFGAVLLHAVRPRSYIDVNRATTDIDAELLSDTWPTPLVPTEKTKRGLGLMRRYVIPGFPIYAPRSLSAAEVHWRIRAVYEPYHEGLDDIIAEMRSARGSVWHVNWHSMKSRGNAMTPDGDGAQRPDFVVSDRDGASAAPDLTNLIVDFLRGSGFAVNVNTPYKGGHIVQRIGRPEEGVHSVQVEINRGLYLDEGAVQPSAGFAGLQVVLARLTRRLAAAAP